MPPDTFHPLPGAFPFCRVIADFLSPDECRMLIAESEARGFRSAASDYPPSYRTNDRQVVDDEALAARLLERLRGHVPAAIASGDAAGLPWRLASLNARFRLCRYQPGQAFGIHQDGVHHRHANLRSELTFMVYLTDGDAFEGGDTVFFDAGPGEVVREIGRVRPRAGSLIVFDHRLWHAGAVVEGGVKHVLRSDVLYAREAPTIDHEAGFDAAHRGYIWALQALAGGCCASAGRDTHIHVWDAAGRRVASLAGHGRSVLALAAFGDGRLASVSRDRSLRLWNLREGRCTRIVEDAHAATLLAVIALPDGRLATSGADGLVRLWTADGDPCRTLEAAPTWIWSLANLPDGRLAGACEDGVIRIWSLAQGCCEQTLRDDAPLRALAASDDGRWLVSGDVTGRLRHRRAQGGGWETTLAQAAHAAAVRRIRLVGDGAIASVGEDGAVRLSSSSGGLARRLGAHDNFATDVAEVGGQLLSCGYDGRIRRLGGPRR